MQYCSKIDHVRDLYKTIGLRNLLNIGLRLITHCQMFSVVNILTQEDAWWCGIALNHWNYLHFSKGSAIIILKKKGKKKERQGRHDFYLLTMEGHLILNTWVNLEKSFDYEEFPYWMDIPKKIEWLLNWCIIFLCEWLFI